MNIKVRYMREFADDFNALQEHDKALVRAAAMKIRENPFKKTEGGVGTVAVENGGESILSVKISATSLRIVYKIIKSKDGASALVIFASVVSDETARTV